MLSRLRERWLKPRYTFWVATANIQALPVMSSEDVTFSVEAVMHHPAAIIGWQEIQPEYYKTIVRSYTHNWIHYYPNTNTPISVNTATFSVISHGSLLVLPATKKLHADRYLNWVVVKHKRSGRIFLFCNFHQVAGAFDDKHDETDDVRTAQWFAARSLVRQKLIEWVAAGYSVIGVGDYNRRNNTVVGTMADGRVIHYNVVIGLDYIFTIFLNHMKVVAKDMIVTKSDHSAKFAKLKVW